VVRAFLLIEKEKKETHKGRVEEVDDFFKEI
jgi:hypothetical protein